MDFLGYSECGISELKSHSDKSFLIKNYMLEVWMTVSHFYWDSLGETNKTFHGTI
jgi:hypothetical protein